MIKEFRETYYRSAEFITKVMAMKGEGKDGRET
jgi:hypothetical protein